MNVKQNIFKLQWLQIIVQPHVSKPLTDFFTKTKNETENQMVLATWQ